MKLTFGNKEFELRNLNFNDLERGEELGFKLTSLTKLADNPLDFSFKDIKTLVYITLKRADDTVTLEWVGENLNLDNMQEVMSAVANFITPSKKEVPTQP